MSFSARPLSAMVVAVLTLTVGCASQVEVATPVTTPNADTQQTAAIPTLSAELPSASTGEEHIDATPAPNTTPTVEAPAATTQPQSAMGEETAIEDEAEPEFVMGEETAIEDEAPENLTSLVLLPVRAMGGNLRQGDEIMLLANIGDTLDRSTVDLLGQFELHQVTAVFGDEALEMEELPQPVSFEDLSALERRVRLTFDAGDADLTGLNAALANDFVLVMRGGRSVFVNVELPNERALGGDIKFGDTVGLARLDGTVLADQFEILEVRVDLSEHGLSAPPSAADDFGITLEPRSSFELLDLTLAILGDDIQLIAG